jgi:acyl-coenzyme A synthetase/AMP-(fatty) acid ligase
MIHEMSRRLRDREEFRFFLHWLRRPRRVGAVLPSSPALAAEIPKGFVVLKPGTDTIAVTPQLLMDFVAGQVASYKQIRQLEIIDAIPKSPSGKILRRLLRDREQAT